MKTKPGHKTKAGTLQPLLKRLRRHGVKSASFCSDKLISVEFFPYESYYVDNDGTKLKGKGQGPRQAEQFGAESMPDTLRSTVLDVDKLPEIRIDRSELLKPPSDKD